MKRARRRPFTGYARRPIALDANGKRLARCTMQIVWNDESARPVEREPSAWAMDRIERKYFAKEQK